MKKWSVLFFISFIAVAYSPCKNKVLPNFKIDGTINADTGKIFIEFYSDYIPYKTKQLVTEVRNQKFSFSGYIPESQGVFISFNNCYMSSDFILEKGLQTIVINIDSSRTVPEVKNKTMLEERPQWVAFHKKIDAKYQSFYQRYDSLLKVYSRQLPQDASMVYNEEMEALYKESDSTLLKYVEKNPNSKIAFWKLVHLMDFGYEPIFDSIYNAFSSTLKKGYAGSILSGKLWIGKPLSAGQQFPDISCLNTHNEKFSRGIFLKNKLTLVDFWYSNCSPCRRQFPKMRDLYKQYGDKGFDIVGISVDKTEYRKEWENLIVKEELVWQQYLDIDGVEAKRLSISAYPTNFLIDNTGKIITKNISMEELEQLLGKDFK